MKRKILTIVIATITCAILSTLIETLFFNHNVLTLNEKSLSEISYSTETTKDKTIINAKIEPSFVNKLIIDYDSTEKEPYSLSYTYKDIYNEDAVENLQTDIFDNVFSKSIVNIRKTVSGIKIEYDNDSNIKINKISIDNEFHFNYYRAIFVFLALMTIFLLCWFYKDGFKTEKLHIYFATICTMIGLMIIVAQPAATFYSWDDQIHFETTIDWFGGTIDYSNGEYNLSNANVMDSAGRGAVDSADEKQQQTDYLDTDVNHNYTKTASSFIRIDKISYFPMAIGYNLAKLIKLPFTVCFQIGKIFNLLFYVLLISYSIKITKVGKRLLSFISLIPVNIFLASNYSYDPAVYAGITIFLVHTFNLILDKSSKPTFKNALIMVASISYACFAKAIYAPLLILTMLIPKHKFSNQRQSRLVKIGFISIMIILFSLPIFNGGASSDPRGGNTSFSDQATLILEHPADYATVLKNSALDQFSTMFIGSFSLTNFSYLNKINEKSNLYLILIITLIFIFITDNAGNFLTKKHRIITLGAILSIVILIWTGLYLSFTPVGSSTINGVQGRYFLPLLFPLLLSIQPKNIQNKINPKIYNCITISIPTIIMIVSIYTLILVPYSF